MPVRLLAVALIALSLLAPAPQGAAQQTPSIAVDPASQTVDAGGAPFEVRVTVDDITGDQGLGGYTLVMRYDPAVVRGRTITDSGFVASTDNAVLCPSSAVDNDEGVLAHFCFTLPIIPAPGPQATQPQVLARISFEPVAPGATTLDISETTVIDPQGNNLGATTSNGQVTVRGSGPDAGAQPTSTAGDIDRTPAGGGLPGSGDGPGGGSDATPLYVALILVGVGALVALAALAFVRTRHKAA